MAVDVVTAVGGYSHDLILKKTSHARSWDMNFLLEVLGRNRRICL